MQKELFALLFLYFESLADGPPLAPGDAERDVTSRNRRLNYVLGSQKGVIDMLTKTEYATESGREASMNFESRNPATGELLGTYPEHDQPEITGPLQPP